MKSGLWFTGATALLALLVALSGVALAQGAGETGVWVGAGVAFVLQVAAFWILFVWLLPENRVLAHGLGVLARFVVVGFVALVGLPLLGTPMAPTLFSLVTVLFLSTLVEPVVLQIASKTRR